jgi:arylsulfatase A-like enzyme
LPYARDFRTGEVRAVKSGATGLALAAVGLSIGCGTSSPRSPVVLVSIDTLRPDHLGCYGYPRPTSPNLDAFRGDAILFRAAFAHAPSTLPSHASMLTSLLPPHHGASIANDLVVPDEVLTLAEVLRSQGYATASFNGGIQLDRSYGLDQGFDIYESVKPRDATPERLVDPTDRFAHVVDQARGFVSAQGDHAFFLFLHTYEVHHPYTPVPADLAPFRGNYSGPLPDLISVELLRQINSGERRIDDRDRQHIVDAYDGEIRSMDRAFGSLVAFLRDRALYDRALVVVTSDHGEEFGEHGKMGWHSHTLFDELLHVPLLVKLPGRRLAGAVIEATARGIDVAPTILRALDLPVPKAFEGRDLLASGPPPVGSEETWSARDVVDPNRAWALRTPEWKLVDDRLYDLRRDPGETTDVAPDHREVTRRLRERRRALVAARPLPPRRHAQVDDALRERLRALGYIK